MPLPKRSLRIAVPDSRAPGDAVSDREEQPVPEVSGETTGHWAVGGAEPELVDLRLYAPRPDVVIVRVSGPVDGLAARVLVDRVDKQLHRAPHVVIDLGHVSVLSSPGLTVLYTLHQQAMTRGTQLHVVGTEHDAVRLPLHATGLAQLLNLESTTDAVIATLPRPVISRVGSGRGGPDPDDEGPAARQRHGRHTSVPRHPPTQRDYPKRAMTVCFQQWQDAELAMNVARRCFEGWLLASQEDPSSTSTANKHAYHTHEALHEAARAISLLVEAFRVEALRRATTPAGSPIVTSRG